MEAIALALALLLAGGQAHAQAVTAAVDLHAVVRAGDVDAVRQAIAGGADLNHRDSWGRTALIVALQQGKTAIGELLIRQGASISLTDAWGRTPLLVASQLKNTAAIRLLLARAADVNLANKNDITPLMATAQNGNLEAMGLLLEAGASLDSTDNLGWTALMWAASRNDGAAARMLVGKGADVGRTGRDGSTALTLARARGADPELLALLASGSPAAAAAGPAAAVARAAPPESAAAKGPMRQPAVDASRIVRGHPDAPVTIVEYTDFQCPYCAAGAGAVQEVLARFEGQVRLVVKHLPLAFHPMARPAAEIFEALSLQNPAKAWAFYDRLFANPAALAGGEAYLRTLAGDLGADVLRLAQDRAGPLVQARLASDLQEAQRFQFDGVPAFVVDGRVIEGAQPPQAFVDLIEAILRQ